MRFWGGVRSAWLPITTVAATAFVGVAGFLGQPDRPHRWVWLIAALVVGVGSAAAQAIDKYRRDKRNNTTVPQAESAARTTMTMAINDTFDPIAEHLGRLAETPKESREPLREAALLGILISVAQLIGPTRTRASWYRLEDTGTKLQCRAYQGRAGKPKTIFKAGSVAGDEALRMVREDDVIFCRDVTKDAPRGFTGGADHGYRTFISVAVRTENKAYGMLTVDAPQPGDLVDEHVDLLRVLAQLLAVSRAL